MSELDTGGALDPSGGGMGGGWGGGSAPAGPLGGAGDFGSLGSPLDRDRSSQANTSPGMSPWGPGGSLATPGGSGFLGWLARLALGLIPSPFNMPARVGANLLTADDPTRAVSNIVADFGKNVVPGGGIIADLFMGPVRDTVMDAREGWGYDRTGTPAENDAQRAAAQPASGELGNVPGLTPDLLSMTPPQALPGLPSQQAGLGTGTDPMLAHQMAAPSWEEILARAISQRRNPFVV